jgi:uncharacterized protein (UPF0276 family)
VARLDSGAVAAPFRAEPPVPEPMGIGFGCASMLPDALYTRDLLDFVEITPEIFHRETIEDGRRTLVPDRSFDAARRRCEGLPIVVHGVELSIGSAHGMFEPCLRMMDRMCGEWPFAWYSEHLHFQTFLDADGREVSAGVPLPLPPTEEAARLVAARAAAIRDRYGVPFLLENTAYYLPDLPADPEIGDEFGLMDRIEALSGCHRLLDLHNLYCNALNFGFDPKAALARIPLDRVLEIHIAGGSWCEGFYMDGHDGRVPGPVWELLELALSRAPGIAGVVFEILEEYVRRPGPDGIARELERARTVWRRCHPARRAAR